MQLISGTRSKLVCLLILAFALRLAAGVWWQSRLPPEARFAFGDSETYWHLGRALAHHQPFQYGSPDASIFRMPGYPLLLAGLFQFAPADPPVMWARGLGALLGTLAVAGVYRLGCELFTPTTALTAAALATFYPGAIAMSVFVLSEAPFCPLMLAHLAAWAASWREATPRRSTALAVLAGGLAGAATLMRPSWLAFVPFATMVGVACSGQRKKHLAIGVAMMVGLIVVMAPWWVRNARLVGRFVPTTLQVGASLYDGLNPRADGSSEMSFVREFEAADRHRPADQGESAEYRLDRQMRDAALTWAAAHPVEVAKLAGVKFLRMWNIWPNGAEHGGWLAKLVMLLAYVPLLILAIVGAWRTRRAGWPYVLCWLPAVYFTALHMVFVSSIRYREPAMLAMLVLSAATLHGSRPSAEA
jgi:4-amino-4-deoxy-L-arabinose transferase-like glycosyltransferase